MEKYSFYSSLGLSRTDSPEQLATQIDGMLAAPGLDGPARAELQTARAILGDARKKSSYDWRLDDSTAAPMSVAEMQQLAGAPATAPAAVPAAQGSPASPLDKVKSFYAAHTVPAVAGTAVAVIAILALIIGLAVAGGGDDDKTNTASGSGDSAVDAVSGSDDKSDDGDDALWDDFSFSKAGEQLDMHGRGEYDSANAPMAKISMDNARLLTNPQGDTYAVADVTYQANDDLVHDAKLIHDKMVELANDPDSSFLDAFQSGPGQSVWLDGMKTGHASNPFNEYFNSSNDGAAIQLTFAHMDSADGKDPEGALDSVGEILQKVLVSSNGDSLSPADDQIGLRTLDSDGRLVGGFAYDEGALQVGFETGGEIDRHDGSGIGFTDDGHGEFTAGFGRSAQMQRQVADSAVSYLVTFVQNSYAVESDAEGNDGWLLDFDSGSDAADATPTGGGGLVIDQTAPDDQIEGDCGTIGGAVIHGGPNTSCGLAMATAKAATEATYSKENGLGVTNDVTADSPTTHESYDMRCVVDEGGSMIMCQYDNGKATVRITGAAGTFAFLAP